MKNKVRNKYSYGVLKIESGNAFVDRYSQAEEKAIVRTGLTLAMNTGRKMKFFEKRSEAYKYAIESIEQEIEWFNNALQRLKQEK
jgi:prefoldin subunit 5